ncbi:hypothetical protein PYW08_013452 [Mythimna loreyi]|uniref:Uncharacterized protein n=1 Tax=Mythimna loreyi TaxID=667449 RepID=A0ACC2QG24_9NEOP|nr:hypothetical protein PYW08_013452 [Mythimna loreyi]
MFKLVVLLSVAAMAAAKPGLVAPVAYSAVVQPATSSVSQYSSSVVHGSPAVYASPAVYSAGPAVYSAGPAVYSAAPAVYSSPAVYGSVVSPVALSQAPHSPAVVLDAVNGVPLDTPEVVAARAAHYTAKALSGYHHLRKRSVGVAPVAYSSVVSPVAYSSPLVSAYRSPAVVSAYSSPVVSAYSAYPSVVSAYSPLAYSSVYPRALSVHPY